MEGQMFLQERHEKLVIQHNFLARNKALTVIITHCVPSGLPSNHQKERAAGGAADNRRMRGRGGMDGNRAGKAFSGCSCAVCLSAGKQVEWLWICKFALVTHVNPS